MHWLHLLARMDSLRTVTWGLTPGEYLLAQIFLDLAILDQSKAKHR